MAKIDFLCSACGKPGSIEVELTGDEHIDAVIQRTAKRAAHDKCVDRNEQIAIAQQNLAREQNAMRFWQTLCPDEFRKPIKWSKSGSNRRQKLYAAILAWTPKQGKGLYVFGPSGTCKTRFCWHMLHREYNEGRTIVAVSHSDFRLRITALARDNQTEGVRWLSFLAGAQILFVDDLGKGNTTGASEEAFHDLLDKRYRDNRPTVFTSERPVDALCEIFSAERKEAILRRIDEATIKVSAL